MLRFITHLEVHFPNKRNLLLACADDDWEAHDFIIPFSFVGCGFLNV